MEKLRKPLNASRPASVVLHNDIGVQHKTTPWFSYSNKLMLTVPRICLYRL